MKNSSDETLVQLGHRPPNKNVDGKHVSGGWCEKTFHRGCLHKFLITEAKKN